MSKQRNMMNNTKDIAEPFYSPANIKRLEKAVADLEKGRSSKHELIEEE